MTVVHKDYDVIDPAKMVDDPGRWVAENKVKNAHSPEMRRKIGAWRWSLIREEPVRQKLLEWIDAADRIIDFGGAAGPLGYGALVVDRIGEVRGLEDVEGKVDLIFTAHTLEHVIDLGLVLCAFHWKLNDTGRLVVLVPSYRNKGLRAENWPHHAQTFCLTQNGKLNEDWVRLDAILARHRFQPVLAVEGHENIIIFAEKVP